MMIMLKGLKDERSCTKKNDMDSFGELLTYRLEYFFDVCRKQKNQCNGDKCIEIYS